MMHIIQWSSEMRGKSLAYSPHSHSESCKADEREGRNYSSLPVIQYGCSHMQARLAA